MAPGYPPLPPGGVDEARRLPRLAALAMSQPPKGEFPPMFPASRFRSLLALPVALLLAAAAAAAPLSAAARHAELEGLAARMEGLAPQLEAMEAELEGSAIPYLKAHDAVQAVALSRAERVALKTQGLAALPPEKAAVFREAEAPLRTLHAGLKRYFPVYDQYMWAEGQSVVLGRLAEVLDRRAQLGDRLSRRLQAKVDAAIEEALEAEARLREALSDPKAKTYMKASGVDGLWKATHEAELLVEKGMRKLDLLPRRTFRERLRGLGDYIQHRGRKAWIHTRSLPAIAKVVGYLLNPLRKEGDSERFGELLRNYARSFQRASGLTIHTRGVEHVPTDAPVLYAAAHRGGLGDMIAMLTQAPSSFSFLAHWGVFPRVVARRLKKEPTLVLVGVPSEENGGEEVGATDAAIAAMREGRDLLVFAEGSTPSKNGETNPLRRGVDFITDAVSEDPVYIVPIGIKGPADRFDTWKKTHPSLLGRTEVSITFGRPVDPLKLKAIPGSGQEFMLQLFRAFFNKCLDHPEFELREQ